MDVRYTIRTEQSQDDQKIHTSSGFIIEGDTWNNAVVTLHIMLYTDTAVATVV